MLQLAPLPPQYDETQEYKPTQYYSRQQLGEAFVQAHKGPTINSNWILPNRLLVSAYPGNQADNIAQSKMRSVLAAGIRTFVNLQKATELQRFVPYKNITIAEFAKFSKSEQTSYGKLQFVNNPMSREILVADTVNKCVEDLLIRLHSGENIVLHSYGGHFRTSVICTVLLIRMFDISVSEAIKRVAMAHDCRSQLRLLPFENIFLYKKFQRLLASGNLNIGDTDVKTPSSSSDDDILLSGISYVENEEELNRKLRFADRYISLRDIGAGAFGSVYECLDLKLNTRVALKRIICPTLLQLNYAMDEIKHVTNLKHENLVQYKDYFLDQGTQSSNIYILCIVMPVYEKGDMGEFIKQRRKNNNPLSEQEVVHIALNIANGVNYLHSMHLIHRDLKPANIFINERDDSKYGDCRDFILSIGDFGLMKSVDNSFAVTTAGTQIYMAPELFDNEPYDKYADIWSLGCIFMELMCPLDNKLQYMQLLLKGEHQFHADNAAKIENFGYSFEIASLVNKCLTKNPSDRITIGRIVDLLNNLKNETDELEALMNASEIASEEQYSTTDATEHHHIVNISVKNLQFKNMLDYPDLLTLTLTFNKAVDLLALGLTSKFMHKFVYGVINNSSRSVAPSAIIWKELCLNTADRSCFLVLEKTEVTRRQIDEIFSQMQEKLSISWHQFYKEYLVMRFDSNYPFSDPSALRVIENGTVVTFHSYGTYWEAMTARTRMIFGLLYKWRVTIMQADDNVRLHCLLGCIAVDKVKKKGTHYHPAFNKESDGLGFAFNDWSTRKGIQMIPELNTPKHTLKPGDVIYFEFDYRTYKRNLSIYLNGVLLTQVSSVKPRSSLPFYYPTVCLFKQLALKIEACF